MSYCARGKGGGGFFAFFIYRTEEFKHGMGSSNPGAAVTKKVNMTSPWLSRLTLRGSNPGAGRH